MSNGIRKETSEMKKEDADMMLDEYEEPVLLGAEDLQDVTGGCVASCSNGDCGQSNVD
jgi:hypothetical protein